MRIILLCGGEGRRLWPLSHPNRTKPFMRSMQLLGSDETLIVMPADLYVDDSFVQMLQLLEPALSKSQSQLALIGVRPHRLTDQYGYIMPELAASDEAGDYRSVKRFYEKPALPAASKLIEPFHPIAASIEE